MRAISSSKHPGVYTPTTPDAKDAHLADFEHRRMMWLILCKFFVNGEDFTWRFSVDDQRLFSHE